MRQCRGHHFSLALLGFLVCGAAGGLSGCGGEQKETGTQVQVDESAQKDLEAEQAKYFQDMQKNQAGR